MKSDKDAEGKVEVEVDFEWDLSSRDELSSSRVAPPPELVPAEPEAEAELDLEDDDWFP